ncbi:hypothetical protein BJP25_12070 [Actinokineospora bangkokensis]|uniref:SHOCT domain-containing protein n=1 Tax=Actinokineospora bangkokensis TaxID=1193682 RepID=A0A1Q9LR33_9PSEU|nr:hypothetical protein BJP25_12070 [Actinokineospora bangkokensis]
MWWSSGACGSWWPVLVGITGALVLLGGLVAVVAVLVRGSGRWPASPRRVLDERYARGEMDDEEHRRRRDQLAS